MRLVSGLSLAFVLSACSSMSSHVSKGPDADAQFAKLKALAGDWKATGGSAGPGAKVSYRLVSGGSVLLEDLFPGSSHEMVTLYHRDGDALVLTHYCALGNEPTMRAEPTAPDGSVKFVCQGVANLESHDRQHMHEGVFWFVDDDHIRSRWTIYEDGKPKDSVEIELARDGST